ncbi:TonB-dependent receptor [Nitrosomonas sp. HPC101]|uniref:TonB-dependent receptor family protein n=1 Tax=Nitrosomonas sp. HPC101 TaxID=1658667 RepID=UPI001368646D|nr:TonB-dependent receptor [Nitrosomonas sp. HPC101]MXS85895.1 TonB-dependent receptor [Nitrosomonas sp. HPC101]
MRENRVDQAALCQAMIGEIIVRKPLAVAVAGVLTAIASSGIYAQNTDEPIQLETIQVIAPEVTPAITVPSLPEAKRAMRNIPGGANVVDSETYATGRASTLQDALGYSPGVFVQPRAGADESRLSIRGSGIQRTFHLRGIRILQDGSRLNLADGSADFQAIEPLAARYIEVFRGGNALQYGSTTLGGAVNFVTPTGYDAERFRARGEAGSFGYNRLMLSSGGVHGSLDYFASVSRYSQDGFRDWAATENWRMFSNVGYRFNADLETRFYLTYVKSDSQLPGNLKKAELRDSPRQANAISLRDRYKRDLDLIRVANRTTLKLGNSQQLEFSAFYSHKDLWHPIYQVLAQPTHDYGLGLRYMNEMPLAGYRNRFVLGFEPSWGTVMDNRFRNISGRAGARTAKFDQSASSYAVYGEDRFYVLPELSVIVGAQYTYTTRKQKDLFGAGAQDKSKNYQRFTPRAGLIYELNPEIQFFGNVSTSFEPPSFAELTSGPTQAPTFAKAQRAITFEVGSRGRLFDMAEWDVALYRAHVRNELLARVDPVTSSPLGTVNAGKTVHQGVELGLDVELAKKIYLRQMYMFNDFKFDGDPAFGNNQLAGIPRHFYKAELTYRHADGYYIGPNVEWSPEKYYVDHANTVHADSYALLGFKIGKRSRTGFSWFAEARNLTDEKYAATTGVIENARGIDQAQYLPGDGRSFFAGLEYRTW